MVVVKSALALAALLAFQATANAYVVKIERGLDGRISSIESTSRRGTSRTDYQTFGNTTTATTTFTPSRRGYAPMGTGGYRPMGR